ncbi:MAG: uracil-DNA glycosylase family protein [Erythrobacter sp.]
MNAPTSPLAAELDAALHWWRLAGVDLDFADDATSWLSEPGGEDPQQPPPERPPQTENVREAPAPAKIGRVDLLGPNPPEDLDAFCKFWLEAPGLDSIGPRGRVAPRGPTNAELMVLVIDPEERDGDRLLSGAQGRLLSRMLAAMGISEEETYIASALPRHTPMADCAGQAASGMDAVTLHHIALAAPKRILAFGSNIPPLMGLGLTKDILSLREINQKSRSMPLMVSEGLDSLMTMPRLKTRFWRRWIEWAGNQ